MWVENDNKFVPNVVGGIWCFIPCVLKNTSSIYTYSPLYTFANIVSLTLPICYSDQESIESKNHKMKMWNTRDSQKNTTENVLIYLIFLCLYWVKIRWIYSYKSLPPQQRSIGIFFLVSWIQFNHPMAVSSRTYNISSSFQRKYMFRLFNKISFVCYSFGFIAWKRKIPIMLASFS